MANEGSTKPTYSELETSLARVRGLLQRILDSDYTDDEGRCMVCEWRTHSKDCPIGLAESEKGRGVLMANDKQEKADD